LFAQNKQTKTKKNKKQNVQEVPKRAGVSNKTSKVNNKQIRKSNNKSLNQNHIMKTNK